MSNYKNYSYLDIADEKRAHAAKKGSFLELLLFWILPFIVINLIIFLIVTARPDYSITIDDPGTYRSASVTITIKSLFPHDDLEVSLASEPLELEKQDKKTYTATIETNGTLEVRLRNKNGIEEVTYENISIIDDTPPIVTVSDAAPGYISVNIEDSQSGVNFGSVYALDALGEVITPSLVDEGESLAVFNYDSETIEIHAMDLLGHESVTLF